MRSSRRRWYSSIFRTGFRLPSTLYGGDGCFLNEHLFSLALSGGLQTPSALLILSSPQCCSSFLPNCRLPEAVWVSSIRPSSKEILTLETDYCVAAIGIILIISTFQWIIDGRKNYTGPRMNVDVVPAVAVANEANDESKGTAAEDVKKWVWCYDLWIRAWVIVMDIVEYLTWIYKPCLIWSIASFPTHLSFFPQHSSIIASSHLL